MTADFEVKTGWIVETIEDFCIRVADGTHDSPQRADIGKPLVTSKNIIGGRLDLSNTYNISVNDFIAINKRSAVHKNDVLLSMIGTVGEACLIEEEPNFAIKNVGLLKNDDEYKAKWLYFYLRSPKAQQLIKERLRGTTQQYLPLGEIRKFPVLYPQARHELELIVDNLWTLHSKIELNRQINQTLESMAQIIFKSWFVDFEPVKAKIVAIEAGEDAEGVNRATMRAISGKTDDELDQMQVEQPENYAQLKTTAELFPAAMQDSELGKVPEGWEVKLSGEIMDVRDGTHDSPKKSDKGFPLLTSKHITSGILMMDTAYLISQQDYENVNKRSKVNQGDILLTMIGTVGIPYLVMQRDVNFAIKNVGLFRTSENICLKNYYYLLLKSEGMQKYLEARMAGTTQKYLSLKTLRSIELLVPSGNIMDCFNVITNSLLDYSYALQVEAGYLAKLRDILLPKLLSGELSVDAIKITNEQAGE